MTTADALVDWFEAHARDLPWREEPRDAYRTLVSEFMLQQTQVDRVVPRFMEFVETWPDLKALASASIEQVLGLWSGLGYYRRARMLHRLAHEVIDSGGDALPSSIEGLLALPGIGSYTAAAVGSLAFGLEEPVLDGNVRRVVARVTAFCGDPRKATAETVMKEWVRGLFPGHSPGVVNEALMELGATVCTPAGPKCEVCPMAERCSGRKAGRPEDFPVRRRTRAPERLRWVAACFIDSEGRWLLRKVQDGPILRGLWLPPVADLESDADPTRAATRLAPEGLKCDGGMVLDAIRHHITHRRIEVLPVRISVSNINLSAAVWQWAHPGEVDGGTSSLFEKLHKVIENNEKNSQFSI